MITLENVNKYFNRHKKNEVHVINNISLNLENNGLIAFLGPSGCGKTTILNVIGGLDKIKSGKIYINNKKISSKCSYKVDKIRNINIGYIFQDYKLIDNLSVFDNVALVLTMIGIKDKKEIKKRVEYVLEKVGMERYKNRPAGMLSGGERQRVAVARAIVKDPDIILADEPTGNLDSKNSLEIMKIIKSISKERLVLLVTHEESLARFYADRIIELSDGKAVKDFKNTQNDALDYEIDNNIYLKDFEKIDNIKKDNTDINIYKNNNDNVKLDIIIKNGNIYLRSNENKKIEVIDDNSSIELIDDHYKSIAKEDIDKYNFDFKNVINSNFKKKYSSIFNPITLIKNGFKKVFDYPVLKKILLLGFFVSAMFIMFSISSICALFDIKDESFVKYNKDYLIVNLKKINVDDYLSFEQKENINYILPGDSLVSMKININDYYQTSKMGNSISGSLSSYEMINKDNLIYGRMPENDTEVVVDKMIIDNAFDNDSSLQMAGITDSSKLLDRTLSVNSLPDFKIVGISNTSSPTIYTDKSKFLDIIYNSSNTSNNMYSSETKENNFMKYSLFTDKIDLKKGRTPENDYETIVNISNKDDMPLNKEINEKINGRKLVVVGYYDSKYNYNYYFVNDNTIKYNLIKNTSDLTIYSSDKSKTLEEFRSMNLNINDSYNYSKDKYLDTIKDNITSTLILSGIILAISLIEIFFMIRSSFMSRIKEIGIYRAIGVKKSDIYKMFSSEIFAITTIAGLPEIVFMAYILYNLSKIKYISGMFLINANIIIITIVCTYLFNLIIGLFPVFNVLKKRPAGILSRHDL